jgi:signal transduction histidine kinase/CheY-like chemotaxis protein
MSLLLSIRMIPKTLHFCKASGRNASLRKAVSPGTRTAMAQRELDALPDPDPARALRTNSARLSAAAGRSHEVQFYEEREYLCDKVAAFIWTALGDGDPVIVIATGAHEQALQYRLEARLFDVPRAVRAGHIVFLEAETTLATFMVGDQPDAALFESTVGDVVREARARHHERPLRAYGEMVDVLVKRGNVAGAIRLEELWNDLAESEEFSLLCGYSLGTFRSRAHTDGFDAVCRLHSHVRPTETFAAIEDTNARLREVSLLQQRAKALEAEIERREQTEKALEALAHELENANRTKDDFLATVSHELRTPLNAMLGWTRMLRTGGLSPDKQQRALETIERNANAQAQLIEDLLDVSRIISGKLRLSLGSVDLTMVVENAIDAVRPSAQAKGVSMRHAIDPRVDAITGDAERLQQAAWNLLTNAVKFTPQGGSVSIGVHKRDSSVDIVVTDDGRGIAREFLPSVFERFRQADSPTTRKHGGLGLGLAIVRHLIELHGGGVRVDSEGLGRGATFTISLPLSPPRASSTEGPPALRIAPTLAAYNVPELNGVHVLVVDDEADARELISEMLESCKARVTTAASAEEAMARIRDVRPDVIVSDIAMPGEDGYDLIRRLRTLPEACGRRTPAVALPAYTRFADRTRALVAGCNMHVPKPVEPTELIAVLSSLTTMFAPREA